MLSVNGKRISRWRREKERRRKGEKKNCTVSTCPHSKYNQCVLQTCTNKTILKIKKKVTKDSDVDDGSLTAMEGKTEFVDWVLIWKGVLASPSGPTKASELRNTAVPSS